MLIHDDYLFVLPFWFVAVLTITLLYIQRQYLSILANICYRFDQCVAVLTQLVYVLTKDVIVLDYRHFGFVSVWVFAVLDRVPDGSTHADKWFSLVDSAHFNVAIEFSDGRFSPL